MINDAVMSSDPAVMSGSLVFAGTRVPVNTLFVYLAASDALADFLKDFPTVEKKQALAALEIAKDKLIHHERDRARESAA